MRHPGLRGRLGAAVDAGTRRIWVTTVRAHHSTLVGDLLDAFGSSMSLVADPAAVPEIGADTDLVVVEPLAFDADAQAELVAAAPRSIVVLGAARAARASSPLLDEIRARGVVLDPEAADGAEWEAWLAATAGLDRAAAERVLADAADVDPWVELIGADLAVADVEDPGAASALAGLFSAPGVAAAVVELGRDLDSETLAGLETLAADPSSRIDHAVLERLADEGLLASSGQVVPAVVRAVLDGLSIGRRRQLIDDALGSTREVVAVAHTLDRLAAPDDDESRAARLAAAAVVVASDPALALEWCGDRDSETRLHALVGVGRMREALTVADRLGGASGDLVTAAALAHAARLEASATAYATLDDGEAALAAVPHALLARPAAAPTAAPGGLTGLAIGAFADGATAVIAAPDDHRLLLDAAEHAADVATDLWPDTPAVVAALVASQVGEHDLARDLLDRAEATTAGGAAYRHRRTLAAGWVALRAGQWTTALDALAAVDDADLALREQLAAAGLSVALAHRRGDAGELDAALAAAVPLVRRHAVDLLSLGAHGEIAIGAAKCGHHEQAAKLLHQLAGFVAAAGPAWQEAVAWTHHVARLASGLVIDPPAVAVGDAGMLAAYPGSADLSDLERIGRRLLDTGQVLEAALLAGAVSLESEDEAAAKAALRLAREFRGRLPRGIADESSGIGALSDRELEIAREVVDGFTYKEIGARLFISPKTVEHHVAHIRTKLGAGSRAEMLAALRDGLG